MAVALLDSSASIAYLDADDALHLDAVDAVEGAIRSGSPLAISAVSWAEILNGAYQGHHDVGTVRGFVADLGVAILAVDVDVAERAAWLQAEYAGTRRGGTEIPKLRTPDALILATAALYGDIDTVVCGESKWSRVPGVDADMVVLRGRTS